MKSQKQIKKSVTLKLVATDEIKFGGRTEKVYTYVSTDNQIGIQFHAHPKRAFCYVATRTHNLTANGKQFLGPNIDAVVVAFLERGVQQHELGGWDKAIGTLKVKLY